MSDIFSDLDGLGLEPLKDEDIFKKKEEPQKQEVKETQKQITTVLFDSKIDCPICSNKIPFKAVRSGQLKLVRTDLDLRPIYDLFDPALYDVIVCNICGYAALKKHFSLVTPIKQKLLKEKVSVLYRGKTYSQNLSYEEAIERYKLALYDAVVMNGRDSEKAYLCLKIAWLYRGYQEQLKTEMPQDWEEKAKVSHQSELVFLKNAVDGFVMAIEKESFPAMDLSETTVKYILGDLSRRLGDFPEATKWIGQVLVSKDAGNRLKDRARECKELINKKSAE